MIGYAAAPLVDLGMGVNWTLGTLIFGGEGNLFPQGCCWTGKRASVFLPACCFSGERKRNYELDGRLTWYRSKMNRVTRTDNAATEGRAQELSGLFFFFFF